VIAATRSGHAQRRRRTGGSLLSLAYCFSYAAFIFAGPLQPFLSQGVAAALITAAVTATIIALTSGFRSAVAGPDSNTTALLAAMMTALSPAMSALSPNAALALAMTALALATLLTGLALFSLGWLQVGKLVRFIPYPVVAGFLAATGWLMVSGAVNITTGIPMSWQTLPLLAEPDALAALLATVGWGAAL
jgi:SulP family sulfate permease